MLSANILNAHSWMEGNFGTQDTATHSVILELKIILNPVIEDHNLIPFIK